MAALATSVDTEMNVDVETAFLGIVPIDLTTIFTGYGPLPAVTGTEDQIGAWDAVGQTRTVRLSDGSSANERLDEYDKPRYFSYTVSGFTGSLRFLTTSAKGEWWFAPSSNKHTRVKWKYAFHSRNLFSVPILWFIANVLWRGYMRKALQLSKKKIEKSRA